MSLRLNRKNFFILLKYRKYKEKEKGAEAPFSLCISKY